MSDSTQLVAPLVADEVIPKRRPLRVCHVAYTFYENDNRVLRYAEALASRGDSVDVIALRRAHQSRCGDSRGVRVYRIQRRAVTERSAWEYLTKILCFALKSFLLLTALQLRRRYDIIHVHNVPDFLVFTALVPRLAGARVILDIHDILPEFYAGKFGSSNGSSTFRWLLRVERVSCRFAHHVIVANDLWRLKLVARAVLPHRCTTLLNYPDADLFRPIAETEIRRDGKFIILYPGTLNRHQGVDIAIKAFASAKDRMPGAELHIYGEGPAAVELLRLTAQLGLSDSVKLRLPLPIGEIAQIMAAADVGVVPKRAEGFGNEAFSTKTLDFMACGVPVIVSRTRIDEYYFDETLVRFFVPGSESDLARSLVSVYADRSRHTNWVSKARRFALRHSWQERVGDYHRLVDSL